MNTKFKRNLYSALIGSVIGLVISIPNIKECITLMNEKANANETRLIVVETVKQIEVDTYKAEELRNVELLSCNKPANKPAKTYTDEDLELLAHLIMAETGSDWLPDEMLYCTGSVVLNRVACDQFPNTIAEVIYQEGQYTSAVDYVDPTDRCYRIARELLEHGSVIPENVVYQAEFIQGSKIYAKIENTYYCEL